MKPCPYCGAQYPDDAVACSVDGNQLSAPVQSEQETNHRSATRVRCPACGASDDYSATVQLRSSFSWLVFLAGGIFAVLFRNAGRPRRVRCNKCEALFDIRTPFTKVSLAFLWLLLCPAIIGLILSVAALLHTIFAQ